MSMSRLVDYGLFFKNASSAFIVTDKNGIILDINYAAESLTGYQSKKLINQPIGFLFDSDLTIDELTKSTSGKLTIVHSLGNSLAVEYYYSYTEEKNGTPYQGLLALSAYQFDMTRALTKGTALYKTFHSNVMGLGLLDQHHKIVEVNEVLCTLIGYNKEALLGKTTVEIGLLSPAHYEEREKIWKALETEGYIKNLEREIISKTGKTLYLVFSIEKFDFGNETYWLVSLNDQTEKRETEKELKNAHKQLTNHLNNSPLGLVEYTSGLIVTQWSPQCEEIFHWTREEILNNNISAFNLIYEEDMAATIRVAEELMSGQVNGNISYNRNYTKSGKIINCIWYNSVVKDEAGDVTSVMSLVQDITESTRIRQSLFESKKQLDLFFNNSLSGFFFMMLDEPIEWNEKTDKNKTIDYVFAHQRITQANQALLDQYRAKEAEFIGLTPNDFFEHDLEVGKKVWIDFFDSGKMEIDTEERRFDGSAFWVDGDYTVLYNDGGQIIGHFGVQHDVTEKKIAQKSIEASELKFRSLFEQSTDGIFISNDQNRFIDVNEQAVSLSGYDKEELLTMQITDILDPEHVKKYPLMLDALNSGKNTQAERILITKNGERKIIEVSAKALTDGNIHAIVRDITAKKRSEDELRASEQLLQEVGEIAKIGGYEFHFATGKGVWSDQVLKIHDLPVNTNLSLGDFLGFYNEASTAIIGEAMDLARTKRRAFDIELPMTSAKAKQKWVRVIGKPVLNKGKVESIKGTTQDITNQKLAEQNIALEKALSDDIINSLPGVFYLFNQEGKFLRWNRNFEMVTGYTEEEIALMHPIQFFTKEEQALIAEKIGNVFVSGEDNVEANFLSKDGSTTPYYFKGIAINYDNQTCLTGVGIDISDRVRAEKSLQKTNEQLKVAQQIAKLGYFIWDFSNTNTYWSDEVFEILGLAKENGQISEAEFIQLIHPEDRDRVSESNMILEQMCLNGGGMNEVEFRFRRRDNLKYIHLRAVSSPVFDRDGKYTHIEGTFQDITESKKREEKLKISIERFHLISLATNDALFEWNPHNNATWWSDTNFLVFGFDPEKPIPTFEEWLEKIHPDDRKRQVETLRKVKSGELKKWSEEIRVKNINGRYKTLIMRCYTIQDVKASNSLRIIGSFMDITDRKRSEEEIRLSNERFELIAKATNDAIWDWDISSNIITGNDRLYEFYGIEKGSEDLSIELFYSLVHEDDLERVQKTMNQALSNRNASIIEEYRFKSKNGDIRSILDRTYIIYNEKGTAMRMLGAMQDITNIKNVQKEFEILSNRLLLATTSANLGIFDWDIHTNNMVWNDEMHEMYDLVLDNGKISYNTWVDCIHPKDLNIFESKIQNSVQRHDTFHDRFRIIWKTGEIRHIEAYGIVTRDKRDKPLSMIGVCRDITDLISSEQLVAKTIIQTQEKERFEIGRELHDNIIQLLVAAQINLNQTKNGTTDIDPLLGKIHSYVGMAVQEIRQLSHQLAPSTAEEYPLDESIQRLLEGYTDYDKLEINFNTQIKNDSLINKEIKLNLYRILQEQLNNIIKHSKANQIEVKIVSNESRIYLLVNDNGVGFDLNDHSGGIGLMNIKRRVEIFDGNIEIESEPGKGCQITVEIPLDVS